MKHRLAAVLCSAVLGWSASSSLAITEQRAPKLCGGEVKGTTVREGRPVESAPTGRCIAVRLLGQFAGIETAYARGGKVPKDGPVYSSIKEIMELIIDPSADVVWGAAGSIVDKEGDHELLPKTPEEWLEVRKAAVRLIEGANLLVMPVREAAPAGTKSETPGVELEPEQMTGLIRRKRQTFNGFARQLQQLGVEFVRASDAKDKAALIEVGGRMENVCESCHQTFWYPPPKQSLAVEPHIADGR